MKQLSFKQIVASMENYGNTEGDYAQLEPIVLKDLQQNKGMFKNIKFEDLKKDPALYDEVVNAYYDRLGDFGIPDDPRIRGLWWLMPGRYRKTGGDITKIDNSKFKNIMANRVKNMTEYIESQEPSKYTEALGENYGNDR